MLDKRSLVGGLGLVLLLASCRYDLSRARPGDLAALDLGVADLPRDGVSGLRFLVDDSYADFNAAVWMDDKLFVSAKDNVQHRDRLDLDNDGTADLVLAHFSDSTNGYRAPSLIYSGAQVDGVTQRFTPTGLRTTELPTLGAFGSCVGDLDDDGFTDVVFANRQDADGLTKGIASYVYWGSSTGFSEQQRTGLPTAAGAVACAIADLNRDGYLDVVMASYMRKDQASDQASCTTDSQIFWGHGDRFATGLPSGLRTVGATALRIADLDGDGWLDIVFANLNGGGAKGFATESYVYWNNKGTFTSNCEDKTTCTKLAVSAARDVAVADLDGDKKLDLVFASLTDRNTIGPANPTGNIDCCSVIYWGNGWRSFANSTTRLPTHGGAGVAIADLDADNKLDVVVANRGPWNASTSTPDGPSSAIYYGKDNSRTSGYTTAVSLPTTSALGVMIAPFDGDEYLDVVFGQYASDVSQGAKIFWGEQGGLRSASSSVQLPPSLVGVGHGNELGSTSTRLAQGWFASRVLRAEVDTPHYERLSWVARGLTSYHGERSGSWLVFMLRSAATEEGINNATAYGPTSTETGYTAPDTPINPVHNGHRYLQYWVGLGTDYVHVPILEHVEISYR